MIFIFPQSGYNLKRAFTASAGSCFSQPVQMLLWDNKRSGSMRHTSKREMEVTIRGRILVSESEAGGVTVCPSPSLAPTWNNSVATTPGTWSQCRRYHLHSSAAAPPPQAHVQPWQGPGIVALGPPLPGCHTWRTSRCFPTLETHTTSPPLHRQHLASSSCAPSVPCHRMLVWALAVRPLAIDHLANRNARDERLRSGNR